MRTRFQFPVGDLPFFKKKLIQYSGNFSHAVCFDNNSFASSHPARQWLGALGCYREAELTDQVFLQLRRFCEATPDWLFGFFSYDLKQQTEPVVFSKPDSRPEGIGFPLAVFFQPLHLIVIENGEVIIESFEDAGKIFLEIQNTQVPEPVAQPFTLFSRTTEQQYLDHSRIIRQRMANGDLYEMNYCLEFFANQCIHPYSVFNALNEISPSPFASFVKWNHRYLICSSPERFLKKEGRRIIAQPMKGTLKRTGAGPNHLLLEQQQLLHNPKERAENVMIVDLLRNDLAKSARAGSVKVEELFGIYSYASVHQMVSTISATLREEIHWTQAFSNAFPMGSMTGAPKVMAMQVIDEMEPVKRGLFSGSAGFVDPTGDFDFNVVIRSILYNAATDYVSVMAGSAITYDSVPEQEYEECLLKLQPMLKALNAALLC
jgi:para-aminobenzoate synthetase component 1